ncbi:hypothetical protein C8R45DRAFT_1204440 [Mycena sanguinolenta]|nr:hypothetical protein C8R45DRAFT_1204440 [Mycena sanguinolenta]
MFLQSYPSAFSSYRTPISHTNPREKYLAALAEAKAAEAEYLAAEQLQHEENQLRQRLEQIQTLKHQPSASYYAHTSVPDYPQTVSLDVEALRHRIATEERARIVHEQELEDRHIQEAQRKARDLEAFRIHEALMHRALLPSVRFAVSEDTHRSNPHLRRLSCPESCKTEVKPAEDSVFLRDADAPITLEQLLMHFFGAADLEETRASTSNAATSTPTAADKKEASSPASVSPRSTPESKPAPPATAAPIEPQHIDLEDVLKNLIGAAGCAAAPSHCNQSGLKGDLQQLFDTFIGGAAYCPTPVQPRAGSSKSASTTNESTTMVKKTEEEEREERELQEAIRLSLADLSPTASESKGKSPAPAPMQGVISTKWMLRLGVAAS